jgi:hypothetical protein
MPSWPVDRRNPCGSTSREDLETSAGRQTASLAALALTLGLVVAGLFLVNALRAPDMQGDPALVAALGAEQ